MTELLDSLPAVVYGVAVGAVAIGIWQSMVAMGRKAADAEALRGSARRYAEQTQPAAPVGAAYHAHALGIKYEDDTERDRR